MSNDTPVILRRPLPASDRDTSAPSAAASLCEVNTVTPCHRCTLRQCGHFKTASTEEMQTIEGLRLTERRFEAGATLIHEREDQPPLLTLHEGWAFRYKTLDDGRRQILSVVLPGDLLGLQQRMSDGDAADHGVEALTPGRVCQFRREALWTLHREAPHLGYHLTWLAAHTQGVIDENLLSVGRRNGLERMAAWLLVLHQRALPHQPDALQNGLSFPLTQQHLADALGLSLVHTNRSWRELVRRGFARLTPGPRLWLPEAPAMARLAHLRWPLTLDVPPLL